MAGIVKKKDKGRGDIGDEGQIESPLDRTVTIDEQGVISHTLVGLLELGLIGEVLGGHCGGGFFFMVMLCFQPGVYSLERIDRDDQGQLEDVARVWQTERQRQSWGVGGERVEKKEAGRG